MTQPNLRMNNGEYINYSNRGEGDDFLLLHPLRHNTRFFDSLEQLLLKSGARVTRFDLPGHGGSSLGREPQTLSSCLHLLQSIVDQADLNTPTFIGVGFGAYLALEAARTETVRPRAVVITEPTLGPPPWLKQRQTEIGRLLADRLTVRTTEILNVKQVMDLHEARLQLTRSNRALAEYEQILSTVEQIDLHDLNKRVPIHSIEIADRDELGLQVYEHLISLKLIRQHGQK